LVSPMASFPQASPPTPCAHLYPPPYVLHALPISFVSILPPAQYWVRSTDHSAPRYAAFQFTIRNNRNYEKFTSYLDYDSVKAKASIIENFIEINIFVYVSSNNGKEKGL